MHDSAEETLVMLLISRFIVILSEAKDLKALDPSLSLRMTRK